VTRGRRGRGRVSRGTVAVAEGETTMQSSKEGVVVVRGKGVLGVGGAEGWGAMAPVGMLLASRTRCWFVWRVAIVPSMVGEVGLRLK